MFLITARSPGNGYGPTFSSEMATAVQQAIAAHLREVSVVGWSSITSSNVATVARTTFRICGRYVRPVTTVGTAVGGGGIKSSGLLAVRPAGGEALLSAYSQKNRLCFATNSGRRHRRRHLSA
jgi:hypothetical protein